MEVKKNSQAHKSKPGERTVCECLGVYLKTGFIDFEDQEGLLHGAVLRISSRAPSCRVLVEESEFHGQASAAGAFVPGSHYRAPQPLKGSI